MKEISRHFLVSIAAMLFLTTSVMFPVHAQTPEIYMTPSVNPPAPGPYVGFKWNVTVWLKDYTNVFAWQVKLLFASLAAGIVATRAWNAKLDPDYIFFGDPTADPTPVIGADYVLAGDALIGGAENPPPDPAKLAIIEFQITKAPGKFETLSTALNLDNADTYLLDPALNQIPCIKTNGTYAWVWTAPTSKPHFEVLDDGLVDGVIDHMVVFPSSVHAIGTVFNVEVYIVNLDVGWAITAASFTLSFDTTVIDTTASDVDINVADWDGPWVVTVTHAVPDTIDVSVSTTKSLSGSVLIATISFTVMKQGSVPPSPSGYYDSSPLTLGNEFLQDHAGPIINDPSINGEVYVYAYTPPVGGEWVPINAVQMLVQIIGSAAAISAVAASLVGFKRIKKKQN